MTIEVKNDEMLGRTNENTLHIELMKLQQENQELKNYMMDLQKELNEENLQCSKYAIEIQDLKEQLHNASIQIQEMIEQDIECPSNCSKLKELKNQQKEFIEYLTCYIDFLKNQEESIEGLDIGEEHILMTLEEVLDKYKEIIGNNE